MIDKSMQPVRPSSLLEYPFCTLGAFGVVAVFLLSLIHDPTVVLVSLVFCCVVFSTVVYPVMGIFWLVALTPFESVANIAFMTLKVLKLAIIGMVGFRLYLAGRGKAKEHDPYRKVIYCLVAAALYCTLLAPSLRRSAQGLSQIVVFWALYWSVRRMRIDEKRSATVLYSLIAVAVPIALVAILQALTGYEGLLGSKEQQLDASQGVLATFWPSIQRASGTFGSSNAAGAFFAASALAAVLHVLLLRRGRLAYLFVTVTAVIALFLTFSRGAILGLLAGLLFAVCILGRARLRWTVSLSILGLMLVLFVTMPLSTVLGYLRVDDEDLMSASVSRVRAWNGALVMIREHPVSGIGFYGFKEELESLDGSDDAPEHPHNGLLKAVVEEGALGGFAYLFYFAVFLKNSVASVRRFRGHPQLLWILCSIAVVGLSLFAQELVDAGLTMGGSSIAILFSILLGLQTSLQNSFQNLNGFAALSEPPLHGG
jgi:Flp pilus assembly pilin Flp